MSQEILKALEKYGLSKQESKVYIALVKRLEANITELSNDTSIPRSTVYKNLDSLEKNKLVSKFMKNKVRYYSLTKVKQLQANLEEKQEAISMIMPHLQDLIFTASKDPSVTMLTGKEGFHIMWEDILEVYETGSTKENYAVAGLGAHDFNPRYFPAWKKTQKKLRVKPKIIYPENLRKLHDSSKSKGNSNHIEQRYIPDNNLFKGAINLYGNSKVAIASFDQKKPHLVIIDSPEIYQLLLMVWKFMWMNAKT